MGDPEAERRAQVAQSQVVRLEANWQVERQYFQREAYAASEGRAQERRIYEEAFMCAERFYENKAMECINQCRTFMQEEMEQSSRRRESEKEAFQRLKEQEVQKVREAEMNARAATNLEASVCPQKHKAQQEVQLLHKEAFQLNRREEALVADLQQATTDLIEQRQYPRQGEMDVARNLQHGATEMTEQVDAMWRQEYHKEMDRLEQSCQEIQS